MSFIDTFDKSNLRVAINSKEDMRAFVLLAVNKDYAEISGRVGIVWYRLKINSGFPYHGDTSETYGGAA